LRAGGDAPVDAADVIAGDVAAQFFEVEASSTHMRCTPSKQEAVDWLVVTERETSGLELQCDQRIEFGVGSHASNFSGAKAPFLRTPVSPA
jgi:hypothetical protein